MKAVLFFSAHTLGGLGKRFLLVACAGLSLLLGGGCAQLASLLPPAPTATVSSAQASLPVETLTPTPEMPQPTSTRAPALQVLTLWVPPQFAPSANDQAGSLFQARLDAFEDLNPGYTIKVRVKAVSGPASLLESLSAANAAAPLAVPSLILLPRNDLETAAVKGLIFPLDGVTSTAEEADWYSFARQLSVIQGTLFGMPFAGDALLLVYRPGQVSPPADGWADVLRQAKPLAFPAGDPQAMLTLNLYLSMGGQIVDAEGRPALQPEVLSRVLQLYADGVTQGVIPGWLAQYPLDDMVWEAYREGSADWLVTWSSRYLAELPADSAAIPLPALGETPVSLCTGWLWALSDPVPERREMAVRLAEFLTASDFLAAWSESAAYLPVRPSALEAWTNQNMRSLLSQVVVVAQPKPTNDLLSSLGPALSEAVLQVIKRQNDPVQAAQEASDRLNISPINP